MPIDPAGSCFGFGVRSTEPLSFLRAGGGDPLEVVVGAADADLGEPIFVRERDGRPFIRLHARKAGFAVWFRGVGWFTVDPQAPQICMPEDVTGPSREARLWGMPAALCFLARGDMSLHAAAVEIEGRAVLLAAPGRFGKSSLAAAFVRAGARLLSEDLSCCRLDDEPVIFPGPALLRMRHDVFEQIEVPDASPVGRDDERVFIAPSAAARGDGRPVPIAAVVFLRSDDGPPRIERVPPQPALPDLWALSFKLPNDADLTRCFDAVARVAWAVPVWNLYRRLSVDELSGVVEFVKKSCL